MFNSKVELQNPTYDTSKSAHINQTSHIGLLLGVILYSIDTLPRVPNFTSKNIFINLSCCDWVRPLGIAQGEG